MEDGWQQAPSRRKRPSLESPPQRAHDLSSLLEEDWFLAKVLEHVVDYGLRSSKLVCWKWYDLCQQFPIKLKTITPDQLKEAVDTFPNAIAVSVKRPTCRKQGNPEYKPIADSEFFELLSSLAALESLEFDADVISLNAAPALQFQSIPQLKRLEITFNDSNGAGEMVSTVRYLTELTRLKLVDGSWEHQRIDPFIELQKIRELDIEFFLFIDFDGSCAFPSLTDLTRLDLQYGWDEDGNDLPFSTEVCFFCPFSENRNKALFL